MFKTNGVCVYLIVITIFIFDVLFFYGEQQQAAARLSPLLPVVSLAGAHQFIIIIPVIYIVISRNMN